MKIGILAAMAEEVRELVAAMDDYEQVSYGGQLFYDGTLSGISVTLVQSGIGKVNAAMATTLLIEHFTCQVILNTGSAGGIDDSLSIQDLVIADDLTYQDADNRVFGYVYGQIPQMPATYPVDEKWLNTLKATAAMQKFNVKVGQVVTGDSFVASSKHIATIKKHLPQALVTEMEGAAVAQVCYQFQVPALVVRCVSDVANQEASVDFDTFIEQAGKRSAQLVISWLQQL
ncbi:5'-methylthioadenosine/adenosylhomocysteine nucleosidase [Allofustis seminis]|uniref:5'-methylthioadenosine/adenosylhomocysteine nucleosidase n=1 Tax=Allofustis seminis TaxID=166939 RepID=UPI0003783EBF|nr:5'-methylthioadenosine/adenosylhomocysteine nucleosidase [Allofustis seminis]